MEEAMKALAFACIAEFKNAVASKNYDLAQKNLNGLNKALQMFPAEIPELVSELKSDFDLLEEDFRTKAQEMMALVIQALGIVVRMDSGQSKNVMEILSQPILRTTKPVVKEQTIKSLGSVASVAPDEAKDVIDILQFFLVALNLQDVHHRYDDYRLDIHMFIEVLCKVVHSAPLYNLKVIGILRQQLDKYSVVTSEVQKSLQPIIKSVHSTEYVKVFGGWLTSLSHDTRKVAVENLIL